MNEGTPIIAEWSP